MKRGHIILIAGAVLLVAGITIAAVWGVSFAGSFLANNTLVAKTTINAGQSINAQNDVTQLDRPMSLTIGIDKTNAGGGGQQQAISNNTRLRETVTDPNGRVVSTNEFSDSFITSFKPNVVGTYIVTVTNLGTNPVSVSGTFGYLPFNGSNGNPDINAIMGAGAPGQGLGMIIAGGVMAVAGIVTLIVGAIITVADTRARSNASTSTTEGGVTYKKD